MKTNENFKSSNTILTELNKRLYVMKRYSQSPNYKDNTFDIYVTPEGGGLDFVFSVEVTPSRKKSVLFNGKSYNDVDTLLSDVETYNNTLPFPSRTYDPMYMAWANETARIHWYLTQKLGMETNYESYSFKNLLGETIMSFSYKMDYDYNGERDLTSGRLFRSLDNNSNRWISSNFTDAEDAIKQINSLVTCEVITSIHNNFEVLERFSGSFSNLSEAKVESIQNILSGKTEKYTDKVIPILETLLKTLKGETD